MRKILKDAKSKFLLLALSVMILISLPFIIRSPYLLRVITSFFMWIGLAQSWNILGGFCGRLNFGAAVFFGMGAYTTGILMSTYGVPFFLTLLAGATLAALVAILIGLPTLRLRGAYFAIATWAFADAMKQLSLIVPITGGAAGMSLPPLLSSKFFYFVMFAVMLLVNIHTYFIDQGKLGYETKAIRDDEDAAEIMGIDTTRTKVKAFVISAIYPAIFGGIFAYWITYIHPEDVFSGFFTDQMVVMTLIGGLGTLAGPVIGATFLSAIREFAWTYFGSNVLYIAFLGVIVCFVVTFMPNGIYGWIKERKIATSRKEMIENIKDSFSKVGFSQRR